MTIDRISQQIVSIAFYLDSKLAGTVSEIWIAQRELAQIKANLPDDNQVAELMVIAERSVLSLADPRRSRYLLEILKSLKYQIKNLEERVSCSVFTQQTFGIEIERVDQQEIQDIQENIANLEKNIGMSRQQVYQSHDLPVEEYQACFEEYVHLAKKALPKSIV